MLIFVLSFATSVSAATLYIDPGVTTLNRSDSLTLAVRLQPDQEIGECINVVDAVVKYSDNIQPVDVSIGKSIFSIWVEQPVINKEERTITFAGGIPNGYCGRVQGDPRLTNVIAELVFRSPGMQIGALNDSDQAVVEFAPETQVLLNDGQGTKADLRLLGAKVNLSKDPGSSISDPWRESVRGDGLPPEEFSITLTKEDKAFGGKYFIVFNTTDKQTGISHYEVIEEPIAEFGEFSWGAADVPWTRTVSPYVLKDQSLNTTIRVKAVDKAGNEYIATLVPDEAMRTISVNQAVSYGMYGLLIVLLLVVLFGVWYVRRRRGSEKDEMVLADKEGIDLEDGNN